MEAYGGLQRFRSQLNPAAVKEIALWHDHPELGKLVARLETAPDQKKFLNTYAEAVVARHLLKQGCELHVEVPTPAGRTCDFDVRVDDQQFYLHIKRLNGDPVVEKKLTISSRLRYLERIARPYVVSIRWQRDLSDAQMQQFVTAAAAFIQEASVGDEHVVRDADGTELGGCRIVAPWEGTHVSLAIGLPTGFHDDSPRIQKLLRKAHAQFMPKAVNVILICSSHMEDVEDFDHALLGTHIERWDAFPPRGRRIAHGRAPDGFWYGHRYKESEAAGWFWFSPKKDTWKSRLWLRQDTHLAQPMQATLTRVFNPTQPALFPNAS